MKELMKFDKIYFMEEGIVGLALEFQLAESDP
jgi:hypothetical protein